MEEFEKVSVIGRGSFGIAFLVKRKETKEPAVVKEISLEGLTEEEKRKARREAEVMAELKHPHIITFYGSRTDEVSLVIIMEYATGGSLHDLVASRKGVHIPEEEVLLLFSQIVSALEFIHSRKVVHGDLSPRNVLLTGGSGKVVKLADFGVSRMLGTMRSSGTGGGGTPGFVAPEILRGSSIARSSDLWAAGALLHFLADLRPPFSSPTLDGLFLAVLSSRPPPLDSRYSTHLCRLVLSLLHYNPPARPTASALFAHPLLTAFLHTLSTGTSANLYFPTLPEGLLEYIGNNKLL